MKTLVCISKTPETTAKISFKNNNQEYNSDGVQFILNPYDEWYALVRAVELKEQVGGTVTVINVGLSDNDVIIRKALAIGADDALRVDAEPTSAYFVAKQIAHHALEGGYDMIFCGKETIDYNGAEVGSMLAEILNFPFISFASKLDYDDGVATITRDIEGGVEVVEVNGPCVISASKGLAEQRIPNMRGIMMAKRKPLIILQPDAVEDHVKVIEYSLPEEKGGVKLVDPENMDELIRLLHEEAKVI